MNSLWSGHGVELFRLTGASFGIAASVFSVGPHLQRRYKLFIVLLEIITVTEMFEVSYDIDIFVDFARK